MRLLITGASGFIGRNVLRQTPADWDVIAVYREAVDFPDFIANERLRHVRAVRCDLAAEADVRALWTTANTPGPVDAALYLAANGDPAASAREPLHDLRHNTVALLTFLEYCPVPRLVYLSSGAVYDGLEGVVTPASPLDPHLPYAISKLACERYVRFFSDRRGAPESYVNVRFFGAYGPYEPLRKITTRFLTAVANGDREFVLRGDGRNLIDFMYVDDTVRALLAIVTDEKPVKATVDLASGRPTSVGDVVDAMKRATGSTITVRSDGVTAEYIVFRSGDSRMADDFGFRPELTFDTGFARLRAFVTAHSGAAVRG
jgi:UDP-glucose 4-epimerase